MTAEGIYGFFRDMVKKKPGAAFHWLLSGPSAAPSAPSAAASAPHSFGITFFDLFSAKAFKRLFPFFQLKAFEDEPKSWYFTLDPSASLDQLEKAQIESSWEQMSSTIEENKSDTVAGTLVQDAGSVTQAPEGKSDADAGTSGRGANSLQAPEGEAHADAVGDEGSFSNEYSSSDEDSLERSSETGGIQAESSRLLRPESQVGPVSLFSAGHVVGLGILVQVGVSVGRTTTPSVVGFSGSMFSPVRLTMPPTPHPGLSVEETPSDGSCLFHALSLYTGKDAQTLRDGVADYMLSHQDDFSVFCEGEDDLIAHCRAIRSPREWGGQLEITAFERMEERPVVVFNGENDNLPLISENASAYSGEPIFLLFKTVEGFGHYSGLSINEGADAGAIFQSAKNAALSQAAARASF